MHSLGGLASLLEGAAASDEIIKNKAPGGGRGEAFWHGSAGCCLKIDARRRVLLACCNLAAGKMHVVLCLCLLQFVNKCQENEDLVGKMFSRPRMYFFFFFLRRIVADKLTI